MKIALCISGYFRYFEKTYPSFKKHVLDQLCDYDVFVHTWSKLGFQVGSVHANAKRGSCLYKIDDGSPSLDVERMKELYGPKDFVVEDFDGNEYEIHEYEKTASWVINTENCQYMWHKIRQCDLLRQRAEKESGEFYDVIIRLRPDIEFVSGFPNGELENTIKNADVVYVPGENPDLRVKGYGGVPDQLAFGSTGAMVTFSDALGTFKHLYDSGCKFHPETLQMKHMQHNELRILRSKVRFFLPHKHPDKIAKYNTY